MKKFVQFFMNPRNLYFLGLIVVFGISFSEVMRGRENNFKIFSHATKLFWQGISPYGESWKTMTTGLDVYLYGPVFNVFFAPFAYLPKMIGPFVWNVFNYSLYFLSIFTLPSKFTPEIKSKIFLYTFLILAAAHLSFQANVMVAYIFLFSFSLFEKDKPFWAIVLILFSGFVKVYGVFQLGLLLCYPRLWRNVFYTLSIAVFFVIIPVINAKIGNVLAYYMTWIDMIAGHKADRVWQTFYYMKPWQNISAYSVYIQLGTLGTLATILLLSFKKINSVNFRLQSLGILMTWMVLFSNAADTHTYLIAMLGYMIWYWSLESHHLFDKVMFYTLLIVVIVVPIDVLCPQFIMEFLFRKLTLHLWLVSINLIRMCYVSFVQPILNDSKIQHEIPV